MENCGEVISLTFGDQGENHVGMEKVGSMVNPGEGFTLTDFENIKEILSNYECQIYDLQRENTEPAWVMIIKNGMQYFLDKINKTTNDLYQEMKSFEWDKKYFDTRRQKVLNKHARSNVCFGNTSISPDYPNKIGRTVGYSQVPILGFIKENLIESFGEKFNGMICEGNRYFDLSKCGIGWHGDGERRKVCAFRLGETMELHFQWFHRYYPVGETFKFTLNNGDMYLMSEKAVGTDWKRSGIYTLRHCAGKEGSKYLKLKE
jgi:hypothetical protein